MAEKTEVRFDSLERQVLIGIVEALLQKYGSDAVEFATQFAQKSVRDQSDPAAIECQVDIPVSNQGSSKATAVAKFKAAKKEKNKKDFDMTRQIL
jgi:homoserine kinase